MRKLALSILIGTVALFGATACSASDTPMVATAEAEALAAMGVAPEDIIAADPIADPQPSAGPTDKTKHPKIEQWRKRAIAKVILGKNVLHGEAVVQTKTGTQTVAVQRGTITALTADSITVKSSDGFSQTWKFAPDMHVVEHRTTIQASELKTGATVALAGPKSGDSPSARLIVIPLAK